MFEVNLFLGNVDEILLELIIKTASIAMGMRRPNLVLPNSHTGDCLKALEIAEDAFPSDKILCRWVELQRLADEFAAQASAQEDSEITVEARDARTRSAHALLSKQISEWKARNIVELKSSKPPPIHISLCERGLNTAVHVFGVTSLTSLQGHSRWLLTW